MNDAARINHAFEEFADWSFPWKFMESVLCAPSLGAPDLDAMNQIWAEATSETHWTSADLATGAHRAEAALAQKYPWLTPAARTSLARAASYQWK